MKKKIVLKLSLADEDSRRDAMKQAVQVPGVSSATVDKEKGQMTVVGEDVDPVNVTKALRRGNGMLGKILPCVFPQGESAQLVSVEEVKPEKKEEKKDDEKKKEDDKKKDGDKAPAPAVVPWAAGYPYGYYNGGAPPGYPYPYYQGGGGGGAAAPPGYQWVEVSQPRGWFDW